MNDNQKPYGPQQGKTAQENPVSEPILNVPPVTLVLVILIIGIYALRWVISDELYELFLLYFSFIPERFTQAPENHDYFSYVTLITYMFFHGNGLHIILNSSMLLAIGSGVEKVLRAKRYLLFLFLCGVISIFSHYIIDINSTLPLIGISGAVSGLFGAVLIMMQRIGRIKKGLLGILPIVIIWTIINIVFGFIGIPGESAISIAWVAHLGGFYSGIALFPLFLKRL